MSLKLYTYMPNYRAWKALVAAEYNGVKVDVPEFKMNADNTTPEFLQKNPLGKVPVLETPQGCIFESNAITRYIARLRQDTQLYGSSFFESAEIDQWIDFCANELEPSGMIIMFQSLGIMDQDKEALKLAQHDVRKALIILEKHLLTRTYLVGHQITLADIVIACTTHALVSHGVDASTLKDLINVRRWLDTCLNQPQFVKVLGKVEAVKEKGGKKASKKADKGGKKEKGGKKASKKEEAKPKVEEKKEEAKPKKKVNPLDELPPSEMRLDTVKKSFFQFKLQKDLPAFWPKFWQEFDAAGYSFYRSRYGYNSDNRVFFMTCNLLGGWLQRLDSLSKYAFGSVYLLGKDEDTPPFELEGVWLFRGTGIPFEMTDCPDSEYHKFEQLDIKKDRKLIEAAFIADKVDGKSVLERRYFK